MRLLTDGGESFQGSPLLIHSPRQRGRLGLAMPHVTARVVPTGPELDGFRFVGQLRSAHVRR